MLIFLIPLLIGFMANLASAFTMNYSQWWGERSGRTITIILRNILGIPVWAFGFILAIRTNSPMLFGLSIVNEIVGWLLISIGCIVIIAALYAIRIRAAAPSTHDNLVQNGIYNYIRHPIHTGTILEFIGIFLIKPTLTTGIACFLGFVWVLIQTVFEEYDLLKRIPEYRDYMNQVGRFLPRTKTN